MNDPDGRFLADDRNRHASKPPARRLAGLLIGLAAPTIMLLVCAFPPKHAISAGAADGAQETAREAGWPRTVRTALAFLCESTGLPVVVVRKEPLRGQEEIDLDPLAARLEAIPTLAHVLNATVAATSSGWLFHERGLRKVEAHTSRAGSFEPPVVRWAVQLPDSVLLRLPAMDVTSKSLPVKSLPPDVQAGLPRAVASLGMRIKGVSEGEPYEFLLAEIPPERERVNVEASSAMQFHCDDVTSILDLDEGVTWSDADSLLSRWARRWRPTTPAGNPALARVAFDGTLSDMVRVHKWAASVDPRFARWYATVWIPRPVPEGRVRDLLLLAAGLEQRRLGGDTHLGPSCDGHTWNVHEYVMRWVLTHDLCPASLFESWILRPRWRSLHSLDSEQTTAVKQAFDLFAQYNAKKLLKGLTWRDLEERGQAWFANSISLDVYLFSAEPPHTRSLCENSIAVFSATPPRRSKVKAHRAGAMP